MSNPIVTETMPHVQSPPVGAEILDTWCLEQIALALARRAFADVTLAWNDVLLEDRKAFLRRAALALRAGAADFETPATYVAVDAMIAQAGAGPLLGSLPRQRRRDRVRLMEAALRTYRKALAGEVPGVLRAMRELALADLEAEHAERRAEIVELGGQS